MSGVLCPISTNLAIDQETDHVRSRFLRTPMPDLHTGQKRQQDRPDVPGDRDGCHFRGMPIRASETEEVRRAAQRACVLDTTGAGIKRSVIWPKGDQSDEQRAFRVGIPGDGLRLPLLQVIPPSEASAAFD